MHSLERANGETMSYDSVDALQKTLAKNIFHYSQDSKKAAGRALGTLVEIISFYLLKSWGYETSLALERRIPEYANAELTHNVEFTLHPTRNIAVVHFSEDDLPITAKKIMSEIDVSGYISDNLKSNQLLSAKRVLRNSCTIYEDDAKALVAYLGERERGGWNISIESLSLNPFAMFECKRVGVEEGASKGPQTIEKAKQGAYVAGVVSSLQKLRMPNGSIYGAMLQGNGSLHLEPYEDLLDTVINSQDLSLLKDFILTVGIVSNHGNWFKSADQNKELKVLAQAYDWLLFLTDEGLAKFVEDMLLSPKKEFRNVQAAFLESYTGAKGQNIFTKVRVSLAADRSMQEYFGSHISEIENWFNVISPANQGLDKLRINLDSLVAKNWKEVLK